MLGILSWKLYIKEYLRRSRELLKDIFSILPISINKVYILFHNLACEIGYFGMDCDVTCPFPSYGHECQLRCTCEETDCDFVNGCRRSLNGNFLRQKKIIKYNLIIFFSLFQSLAILNFISEFLLKRTVYNVKKVIHRTIFW